MLIEVIHGKKGSGKTKRILDMANLASQNHEGDVVFIDDDNRYMYDLRHEVRFINAGDYGIKNAEMFMGFICGIVAQNHDMSLVFIDAFLKLIKTDIHETKWFFAQLDTLAQAHHIRFVISISGSDEELPEFIRSYFI